MAAGSKNRVFRVRQRTFVFRFGVKIRGDPSHIEAIEGLGVAGREGANDNLVFKAVLSDLGRELKKIERTVVWGRRQIIAVYIRGRFYPALIG